MAQPSRKADFFVRPDGICIPKAKPLKFTERLFYLEKYNFTCQLCNKKVSKFGNRDWYREKQCGHVDHIFPRCLGGQNNDENLTLLCRTCNLSKGQKSEKIIDIRGIGSTTINRSERAE